MTRKKPLPPPRPHLVRGTWMTETGRFADYAKMNLHDTERLTKEVLDEWPKPKDESILQEDASPALWEKSRRRDMASDSTKLFSAIAVEAFLNFYGVVRLTEAGYGDDLEKKGLVTKVLTLIEHCDGIKPPDSDRLTELARRIANRRTRLTHARSKELPGLPSKEDKAGDPVPGAAQEAYSEMLDFFREFQRLVPDAAQHFPDDIRERLKQP
jgi:hypothetical protein